LRANLEPVVMGRSKSGESYANWNENAGAVVWNAADLATNLVNVLGRRIMDGRRMGCERLPLESRFTVELDDVAAFIAGELDDRRIEELIWGLMLTRGGSDRGRREVSDTCVPRAYALLKLLFLPRPLVIRRGTDGTLFAHLLRDNEQGGVVIRPEPSIVHMLRGGRVGEACATAMRRLRASGLDPMPKPIARRGVRDGDWKELDHLGRASIDSLRPAAALLIPISDHAVDGLVRLVIRGDDAVDTEAEAVAG
jgi:CRISPR-associated protein Csx17